MKLGRKYIDCNCKILFFLIYGVSIFYFKEEI